MSSVVVKDYEIIADEHTDKKITCYFDVDLNNKMIRCKASGWAEFSPNMDFISFLPDKDFFIADGSNLSKSDKIKLIRVISSPANRKIIATLISRKLSKENWKIKKESVDIFNFDVVSTDKILENINQNLKEPKLKLKNYKLNFVDNTAQFTGNFVDLSSITEQGITISCNLRDNCGYYSVINESVDISFYHYTDTDNHIKYFLSESSGYFNQQKKKLLGPIELLVNKRSIKDAFG